MLGRLKDGSSILVMGTIYNHSDFCQKKHENLKKNMKGGN